MSAIMMYLVKSAVYLTAFYLVYVLLLSRDTSYGRNRAFILGSFTLSLILPLISLETARPIGIQFFGRLLNEVFVTPSGNSVEEKGRDILALLSMKTVFTVYVTGVSIFLVRFLADLVNLIILIIRKREGESRIIRFHSFNTAGFSALGYVFINTKLTAEDAEEIIKHEQNHLRENHFLDIIFLEIIKAIHWYNPVAYLFNRSLREIHEYQADEGCLRSGIPVVSYQCLLLNQVFRSHAFNLTNSFSNPSLVKKRMIMMTRKRTSSMASLKVAAAIPAVLIVFFAISAYRQVPASPVDQITPSIDKPASQSIVKQSVNFEVPPPPPPPPSNSGSETVQAAGGESASPKVEPYVTVEQMPRFPGGDAELLKYIAEHTVYPENAKTNNLQGRVIVRFCVTADGGISAVSVLKGVDPELDAEALRVVNTLPPFEPGRQGGVAVPVWYMVPITFTLR